MTILAKSRKPYSLEKVAVHRRPHGSDHGSAPSTKVSFRWSLEINGGGTGHPWWCTTMPKAVYTGVSGDHPEAALLSQVQVGTAIGVAVHWTRAGGAT